ncbi:MAG: SDR family NAD(P)-dependent oxidoreductase [Gammaproteobacteria bacterium]|nr:SDR family NAD(P)-dependent oxidoreductase [Gammaproteobacteria bacterium]
MQKLLAGKTVVLTGASRGIGKYLAKTLAAEGCNLVLAARNQDALNNLVEELSEYSVKTIATKCDITDGADAQNLIKRAISNFQHIDVLINNAGVEEIIAFELQDPAAIETIVKTNLLAPMQLTRLVLPHMIEHGGHVVNIASLAGRTGMPFGACYAGSKGGLAEWSISLAAELHDRGVHVTTIAPGFISEVGMFSRKNSSAPRTLGESKPADVAAAVLKTLKKPSIEVIVNPKPVRLLMALKALSPKFALAIARKIGLVKYLKSLAGREKLVP